MKHLKNFKTYESLIQKSSLDQLKRVKSMMKNDIDDIVRKTIKEGPKRHVDPLKEIETYQDYMKQNRNFKINQNVITQIKECISYIYESLNYKFGNSCHIKLSEQKDNIEIYSPMKYILDDISNVYGGIVKDNEDNYYLKIK